MPLFELRILEIHFFPRFSYMLKQTELKFCIWLYFTVLQIRFKCCRFASLFVGVMSLLELRMLEYSFPHFSLTCIKILSWNFASDFVFCTTDQVRVTSIFVEVMPLLNLEYWKYTIFHTFLLHALTYWAEFLQMTLSCCTTDQVRVSSIFVGVMPLLEFRILEIQSFPHFSLYYRSSSSVVNLRQFLWE